MFDIGGGWTASVDHQSGDLTLRIAVDVDGMIGFREPIILQAQIGIELAKRLRDYLNREYPK